VGIVSGVEPAADPGHWPAWHDGHISRADELRIDARDRGWLFGERVFETVAMVARRPRFLDRHLERLERGVRDVLGLSFERAVWESALGELAERLPDEDAALRLSCTPGVSGRPERWIQARPLRRAPSDGVDVALGPAHGLRSPHGPLALCKHGARLELNLARAEALARGAFDALVSGPGGQLACGTIANLFVAFPSHIATPSLASGALPGIARGLLLEAGEVSYGEGTRCPIAEDSLRPADLASAQEAWLIGSVLGVAAIRDVLRAGGPAAASTGPLVSFPGPGTPRSWALEALFQELEAAS
jgi:branched-chain amino acid aminotransferase